MNRRFEDLWARAADDGASCPLGVRAGRSDVEVDQLLDTWYRERAHRIEAALVLDQARRLIAGLLAEGVVTPRRDRQARQLIHAIHAIQADDR
jgi:hypothetical protein